MMTARPGTHDDLREERQRFIGPPAPPQVPKFTPPHAREAVCAMILEDLAARIAADTAAHETEERTHFHGT